LFNGSEAARNEGHRSLEAILVADDQDAKALPVRGGRFRVAELDGKSVAKRDTLLASSQQSIRKGMSAASITIA